MPLDQFPSPEALWARYCAAKGYTAFQIIWRLWKVGAKKRILVLVDSTSPLLSVSTVVRSSWTRCPHPAPPPPPTTTTAAPCT